ncbi:MAG: 50S ribosomal protein L6 [Syntrophobacterales bacterium]|nr:MAG: 50S ribosomal protein L6 [Syntrophobacterales bacterium]
MSRIGKAPIPLPKDVEVKLTDAVLEVVGPRGQLTHRIPSEIQISIETEQIVVKRPNDHRTTRSLHGLTRVLIANMITGVTRGFEKRLEIQGIGYRAELRGNILRLTLGFSHPVLFHVPEGIKVEVEKQTNIKVEGIDKQLVGSVAAQIRSLKPPEPYKGKGIRYADEYVKLKVGKAKA